MTRLWEAALILLTLCVCCAGCSDGGGQRNPRELAAAYLASGDHAAALPLLRQALREAPEDPDLRLMSAEAHLLAGRGDLAEVAVDQALARQGDPVKALPLRARALLQQGKLAAVEALEVPDEVPEPVRLRIDVVKARALVMQVPSEPPDPALSIAFQSLFERLSRIGQAPGAARIAAELADLRAERREAERGWQHYRCAQAPVAVEHWSPLPLEGRRHLRVGPGRTFRTPADAAAAARDGDVIEIDPGTYPGGVARWPQNDIVVRGAGEPPVITADGRGIEDRDVWLFTGDNVTVENVIITGARSPYRNGAGIRHTGSGLTLRHVVLRDNENGLLTGNKSPDSRVVIEYSELDGNGDGEGQAHNVYIGRAARFEMRFSYSHGVKMGHLVKSRAKENLIAFNRLLDAEGTSSYLIDLPEGGTAEVIGNELYQGPGTPNDGMISFGGEGLMHEVNALTVAGNTVYNRHFRAIFVRNRHEAAVRLTNNLFGGAPVALGEGPYRESDNLTLPDHGMADPRALDFHLVASAPAVDAVSTGSAAELEYVHPLGYRLRPQVWRPDVGAHERCGLR